MELCHLCKCKYAGINNINIKYGFFIIIIILITAINIEYLLTPPTYAA